MISRRSQSLRTKQIQSRSKRQLLVERLENRRLLAVTTQPLNAENHVVFEGDSSRDTIQFSVVDGFLQHNLGNRPGFETNRDLDSVTPGEQALLLDQIGSLTVNDAGQNDVVSFGGPETFAFATAPVTLNAGTITVLAGTELSTTIGAIDWLASENILVDDGASVITVDGGIRLRANPDGLTNGDRYSVHLYGGHLQTSGTGAIEIEGIGGYASSGFDAGVGLESGATIRSTSTLTTAGGISIEGIGKQGTGSTHNTSNWGIHTRDAGNAISSVYGDISIVGVGGYRTDTLSASGSWGVNLQGLQIESTGTGPDAATISIEGRTASVSGSGSRISGTGVRVSGSDVGIRTIDGDLSIVGIGGNADELLGQRAVDLQDFEGIWSTGTGTHAANISISGQLGDGVAESISLGVAINGAQSVIQTVDGDISISGDAGTGTGDHRGGVSVTALVSSLGTGPQAGNINVAGTAGVDGHGTGTYITGQWSTVDGDITISGVGHSDTVRSGLGLSIRGGIASTGVGSDAGKITLNGTGVSTTDIAANGLHFLDGNYAVTTVDGDLSVEGTASVQGRGFIVDAMRGFSSSGVGDLAGRISLRGTVPDGGRGGKGLLIYALDEGITSVDGDISIVGTAGDGTIGSNQGVLINNFGTIQSTGTGPNAATISIVGSAGVGATDLDGISMSSGQSSAIRSVDGDIHLVGTGGDRVDSGNRFSENRGVYLSNIIVESTGTTPDGAEILIEGTGGESGRNGHGVYFLNGELNSDFGTVNVTGTIPGSTSTGRGIYLQSTDSELTNTAELSFSGTSAQVSGDITTVDGNVTVEGAALANYFGSYVSSGQATFRVESTDAGAQANVGGDLRAAQGEIVVRGGFVSGGNIHSTGTGPDAAVIKLGDGASHQVRVTGPISTVDGPITISNQLDSRLTSSGFTQIQSSVQSTGTGEHAGTIAIIGEGTDRQAGIRFTSVASLETVDGDISVLGSGSTGGHGIDLQYGFQSIRSTGIGENAGVIRMEGIGGNGSTYPAHGIYIDGRNTGVISVVDGDLEIRGTGGAGNQASNKGLELREFSIASLGTSSSAGQILLDGTAGSGTASGNVGTNLREIDITTSKGDVLIKGQGGDSLQSFNPGISTVLTTIESTGSGLDAARISLDGTGGGGTSPHGIWLSTGTEIISEDGDIHLVGQGGTLSSSPPSRSESKGVLLSGNAMIESRGFGEHAASITIEGTGGAGRSENTGVDLSPNGGRITTYDGDISVIGTGGSQYSWGVSIEGFEIFSQGSGESAGTITLDGTGSLDQPGIMLNAYNVNYEYKIASFDGDITLKGTGSPTAIQSFSSSNPGDGLIQSFGYGENAADILIDGQGGRVALNRELDIVTTDGSIDILGNRLSLGASIESFGNDPGVSRDITIAATGSDSSSIIRNVKTRAAHIDIDSANALTINGRIESSLNTADAGTITIDATGNSIYGYGIDFGFEGEVVSTAGDISLTGTAGTSNGFGIASPRVHSLGTEKATAATITLIGTGSDQGGGGVSIIGGSEQAPNLSTVAGDLTIEGAGGNGTGAANIGVRLLNGYIESTGQTKAEAGKITINGTGGNGSSQLIGVELRSSQSDIVSVAGDISITGTAGIGTGSQNHGVWIRDASVIRSTGTDADAADISVSGVSASDSGVYLTAGRIEADGSGQITVNATGPSNEIVSDLAMTGNSVLGGTTASGDIAISVDSIEIAGQTEIRTTGEITIAPRSSTTTVGLGAGTGDLIIDNSELEKFAPEVGHLILGSQDSPVVSIDVASVVTPTPLTLFAESVVDRDGQDIVSSFPTSFGTKATPGAPLGRLEISGGLILAGSNTLEIQIDGFNPGATSSGYDQIQVSGPVALEAGTQLVTQTTVGFVAAENEQFVIIENDGSDPIQGIFEGLPEGTIVENFLGTPLNARISYRGLDGLSGNDVVLTTTDVRNPLYDFSASNFEVPEGDTVAATNIVTIERSQETSIATSVDVFVNSGSATAGVDFDPTPITIDFAPGETSKTVSIEVWGERLVEENETIELSFGNFTDYGFPGTTLPTATLTLINDEFAPVADAGGPYEVVEGYEILLDARMTTDFEDPIDQLVFEWDLDYDGMQFNVDRTGIETNFEHVNGLTQRTVAVRVTDTEGNSNVSSADLTVLNDSPAIAFQEGESISGYDWATLIREVNFSDSGVQDQHRVRIDYGDGSPIEEFDLPIEQRSVALEHAYAITSGQVAHYSVSVEVIDDDDASAEIVFDVDVADLALTIPDNRPTIDFSSSVYTVQENQGFQGQIIATLSQPALEQLVVPIVVQDISATRDLDYLLEDDLLVFEPGETSASLTFVDLDDTVYEPTDETALIGIAPKFDGVIKGGQSQAELRVIDDNDSPPEFFFSEDIVIHSEGDIVDVTVELTAAASVDISIPLTVSGDESDYQLSDTVVHIPAGSRSGAVSLTIVDDQLSEPIEWVSFKLPAANSDGFEQGGGHEKFNVSIDPSDANLISFPTKWMFTSEQDEHFLVTVELESPATSDLVIPLDFDHGTADSPGDFTSIQTVTIPAGSRTATAEIELIDDSTSENSEIVYVQIKGELPEGVQKARGGHFQGVVIKDDDNTEIQFTARTTSVYEDQETVQVVVSSGDVTFTEDVYIPVAIRSRTEGGVYQNRLDPPRPGQRTPDLSGNTRRSQGTILIPQGQTRGTISFNVVNDSPSRSESKELFDIELGSVDHIPGASLGERTTNTITVLDDDPEVSISASDDTVNEKGSVKFTIRLTAPTNKKVRIPFSTYGSAKRDVDYKIVEESTSGYRVEKHYVEINPGKTTAVIRVNVINDDIIEPREKIRINLRSQYGNLRLTNAIFPTPEPNPWIRNQILINGSAEPGAEAFISSSDGEPVPRISAVRGKAPGSKSFSSKSTWVDEGGAFRVTIALNKKASSNLYIPVSFPKGSGRASDNDFTTKGASGGRVLIPAGKLSATFDLHTTDDTRNESNERIRITLGKPEYKNGKIFGSLPKVSYKDVGIRDNDFPPSTVPGTLVIGQYGTYPAPSGNTSSAPTPSTSSPPIIGAGFLGLSLQGYHEDSQVFLDGNLNGVRDFIDVDDDGIFSDADIEEPVTTTFADGSFQLHVPEEFDTNGNGVLDLNEAQIVSIGGVDISTGASQKTRLLAAPGDYLANPLTTLAAKLVQQHDFTLDGAHRRVLESLGLPDFEFGKVSAIQATLDGDLSAAKAYEASVALDNLAVITASYLDGVTDAGMEAIADLAYQQLASFVAPADSQLDLSSSIYSEILISDVSSFFGVTPSSEHVQAVSTGLAAINDELLGPTEDSTDVYLKEIVKRKAVARGPMSDDALQLGRNVLDASTFVTRYTGEPLTDSVQAAVAKTIEPVRIWVSDAEVVEGDDGLSYLEYQVAISSFFDREISVDFETEDDTASALEGDYVPTSGTLVWSPGNPATQTVMVPVNGDVLSELDETLFVRLSNASSGIIQRPIGTGVILADDAFVVALEPTLDPSQVSIEVEGDEVLISQDGEFRLEGRLNSLAPLQILTDPDSETHVEVYVAWTALGSRDLMVTSQGLNDSLYINDELSNVTFVDVLGETASHVELDDAVLEYSGFSTITSDKTPSMTLNSDPAIGTSFQAAVEFPLGVDVNEVELTWTFYRGDVQLDDSTGETAEFTPSTDGTYRVRLDAAMPDGSTSSVQRTFSLEPLNAAPIAAAGGPYRVDEGHQVQLDASATTDPDLPADTLTYQWDFDGDGVFGEVGADALFGDEIGVAPLFDAGALGGPANLMVSLQVSDSYGEISVDSASIEVSNVNPTLTVDTTDVVIDEGASASKTITATDVPGDTVSIASTVGMISSNPDGSWTWTYDGLDDLASTNVTITASDEDGGQSEATFHLTVTNVDPVAVSDRIAIGENDTARMIDLLENDSDAAGDRDPLTLIGIDTSGLRGSASLIDGVVTYDPNGQFESLPLGQSFDDTFTYTIDDGDGGVGVGTVTITVVGANDAPTASLTGSEGSQSDGEAQRFDWVVADVDGDLVSVELSVTRNGELIESLSGLVNASGAINFDQYGTGTFVAQLSATDSNDATVSTTRTVNVFDDDEVPPQIVLSGSSGTELEVDTNEYSWSIDDPSALSAFSVTVTRDTGDGPVAIYSTTDLADASGTFNFDAFGIGIYEVLVVATDGDGDWAGDAASSNAGRTSVVGELYVSTSTRAKMEADDGEWVTLHRGDVTSTSDGDVLFDHSQLSHPWFSWWQPNLNAFHMLADGSMILSTNGQGSIGGQDFRDGGLVRFFGDEWLEHNPENTGQLHQTAQMITTEEQLFGSRSWLTGVDAISIAPDGNLILSMDRNRSLADGNSYHRGDLIKVVLQADGTLVSSELYFDHQVLDATGWNWFGRWFDQGVNVDGAHVLDDGRILLSVSSTATVGDNGQHFKDGDVFVYDPETDLAELLFDEDSFRRNEDVDAVFLGIGNGDLKLFDAS